jgi:galacturan 1,4-alpha-galacturonidase
MRLMFSLTYLLDKQHEGKDTGLFKWHNISFSNITGTSANNRIVWLDCSKAQPCWDLSFENFNVKPGKTDDEEINYVCNNVVLGGDDGLNGCHPSNSSHESTIFG